MALCGANKGIWRFALKFSISRDHNLLVLGQWTKTWMTVLKITITK